MILESTRKFLMKVGEANASDFKSLGKPVPEKTYDLFKILSILEVALGACDAKALAKINLIADWKQ